MFEALTDKLSGAFSRLGKHGTVSEQDLDEAMREVRLALLEADVNFRVAKKFITDVRARAMGDKVTESLTPVQHIIGIVNDELVAILGGEHAPLIKAGKPPTVIMLAGLKGSGKTTTAAKLALQLRKDGATVALVGADPYRVAGTAQLQSLGKQLGLPVYGMDGEKDPVAGATNGLRDAKAAGATTVIVDTAGRSHGDEAMMAEIRAVRDAISPHEVLLVVDAMTGQEAVNVAKEFHDAIGLTGFILTKLDGDARGGAALSIRSVTACPIKFVGAGEKVEAARAVLPRPLRLPHPRHGRRPRPRREGAAEHRRGWYRQPRSEDEEQVLRHAGLPEQYQSLRKMGSLSQLLGMIPGLGLVKSRIKVDEINDAFLTRVEAMILAMTFEERRNPGIINGSRKRRIAAGSGTTVQDVNKLLAQFKEVQKIMKAMTIGRFPSLPGLKLPGLGR